MKSHVDSVTAKVEGVADQPLHVSRFDLSLGINSIPQISMEILPTYRDESGKSSITVSSPSYEDIVALYDELKEKAIRRHLGNPVYGDVMIEEPEAFENGCSVWEPLDGWVLTDVSMSSVMPGEAPTLAIVMKHPAEVLDRVGDIYEKPANFNHLNLLCQEMQGSGDMIPLLDSMYKMFASKINYLKIPGEFAGKVVNFRNKIMDNLPSKYLYSDHGLFLGPQVSAISGGRLSRIHTTALGTTFSMAECSIWQTLIQKVCPVCLMTVVPQENLSKKLHLIPCSPWRNSTETIDGNKVLSLSLTPQDPHPIMGVMSPDVALDGPVTSDKQAHRPANSQRGGVKYTDLSHYYIPEKAQIGELLHSGGNPVISAMGDLNLSKLKSSSDSQISKMTGVMFVSAYRKMNEAYSKALYGCTYRRNCTGTVITNLNIRNNITRPGDILTVNIGSSGTKAITGYINSMVLSGSSKGDCTCTYNLSYVRPKEGSVEDVIPNGTQNCCFTPLSDDE